MSMSKYTCSLDKIELKNFLFKKNTYTEKETHNRELFKKAILLSQLLGRKRKNYTVITIENNYMNNSGVLPQHTTYFTQKIINNKTKEEISLSGLSIKLRQKTIDLKKVVHRLKPVPRNTIDNIPFTYISRSSVHGFGLFAGEVFKENEKIGKVYGQLVNRIDFYNSKKLNKKYKDNRQITESENKLSVKPTKTKCMYINHSRLPNVKFVGSDIIAISKIRKNEEIFIDYRLECLGEDFTGTKDFYL